MCNFRRKWNPIHANYSTHGYNLAIAKSVWKEWHFRAIFPGRCYHQERQQQHGLHQKKLVELSTWNQAQAYKMNTWVCLNSVGYTPTGLHIAARDRQAKEGTLCQRRLSHHIPDDNWQIMDGNLSNMDDIRQVDNDISTQQWQYTSTTGIHSDQRPRIQ